MSEGEMFVLVVSLLVGAVSWLAWYWRLALVLRLGRHTGARWVLYLTPLLCAGILHTVLRRYASFDVVGSVPYLVMYQALGAAWVGCARGIFSLTGVSAREDVAERGNAAAAFFLAGGLLGLTFCFAGGNIGDGPGWYVVVFSALLSTGVLFALWVILEKATGVSEGITVDRDPASGVRGGAFLAAAGMILGRAVMGNWDSMGQTVHDFLRNGWPVLLWLGAAIAGERLLRPTLRQPRPSIFSHGVLPGVAYVVGAAAYAREGWMV